MKKEKKINAINSNAAAYLKTFISPENKVVDMYVKGKWLWAELKTGILFAVKNQTLD